MDINKVHCVIGEKYGHFGDISNENELPMHELFADFRKIH